MSKQHVYGLKLHKKVNGGSALNQFLNEGM